MKYAQVGERIGGWCSILKVRSNVFGDHFGNKVLKVMLRFCLVDVRLLAVYFANAPSQSFGEEEIRQAQGRNWKPKWI